MSVKSMLYTSDNESLQQKELSTDINTDLSKLCSQEIKKIHTYASYCNTKRIK